MDVLNLFRHEKNKIVKTKWLANFLANLFRFGSWVRKIAQTLLHLSFTFGNIKEIVLRSD